MTSAEASSSTLKAENTEGWGKVVTPLNEDIRKFVDEGRIRQTAYASLEGSFDRSFQKKDLKDLKEFIYLMLFYEEDDKMNSKKLTSEQERHVKKMANEIIRYSCTDTVHCQVIWIYFYDHEKRETNSTPLFKVFKTAGEDRFAYIDNNLKRYESWDAYWDSGVLPPSLACVPRNGTYSHCRETGELDLVFLSPKASGRKRETKIVASQPFFWKALWPWIGGVKNPREMMKKMLDIMPAYEFAYCSQVIDGINSRFCAFVIVLKQKLMNIDYIYDRVREAIVASHSFLLLGKAEAGRWILKVRGLPKSLPRLPPIFLQELKFISTTVLEEFIKSKGKELMSSTSGEFIDRIPSLLSFTSSLFFPELQWAAVLFKVAGFSVCRIVKHFQTTGQEVVSSRQSDLSSPKDIVEQLKDRVPQEMTNICSMAIEGSKEPVLLSGDDSSEEAVYLFRNTSLSQLSVDLKKLVGDVFKLKFVAETHFGIINFSETTVGQLYCCGDRFVVGSISRSAIVSSL